MALSVDDIKRQYELCERNYSSFCGNLKRELEALLRQAKVTTATVEVRVKTLDSILEKVERQQWSITDLGEVRDIAGVRIVTVFRRELGIVKDTILRHFDVIRAEDTWTRLSPDQFGYGSWHFEIRLRQEWLQIPTWSSFRNLVAEIQVRTMCQHVWAASSHILQYKKEAHVPPPVRRSIHRIAALLELIDLEYDRAVEARDEYAQAQTAAADSLNTDILRKVLDEALPPLNRKEDEPYGLLVDELIERGVATVDQLKSLLQRHREYVLTEDKEEVAFLVEGLEKGETLSGGRDKRVQRGVYYSHAGLLRLAVGKEFGDTSHDEFKLFRRRAREFRDRERGAVQRETRARRRKDAR